MARPNVPCMRFTLIPLAFISLVTVIISILCWFNYDKDLQEDNWTATSAIVQGTKVALQPGEPDMVDGGNDARPVWRSEIFVDIQDGSHTQRMLGLRYHKGEYNVTKQEALDYNWQFAVANQVDCYVNPSETDVVSMEPVPSSTSGFYLPVSILLTVLAAASMSSFFIVCGFLIHARTREGTDNMSTNLPIGGGMDALGRPLVNRSEMAAFDSEFNSSTSLTSSAVQITQVPVGRRPTRLKRVGFTKEEINKLCDAFTFTQNQVAMLNQMKGRDDSDWMCTICLEDYTYEHKRIVLFPCGHQYHRACLRGWLKRGGGSCCVCNANLRDYLKIVEEKEQQTKVEDHTESMITHPSSMTHEDGTGIHQEPSQDGIECACDDHDHPCDLTSGARQVDDVYIDVLGLCGQGHNDDDHDDDHDYDHDIDTGSDNHAVSSTHEEIDGNHNQAREYQGPTSFPGSGVDMV